MNLPVFMNYDEKKDVYSFRGFFGLNFKRLIERTILTKMKTNLIFNHIGYDNIELYSFYLLELKFIIKEILELTPLYGVSVSSLNRVLQYIEEDTWIGGKTTSVDKLNIKAIHDSMVYKPLKFQQPVFDDYFNLKHKLNLNGGYLDVSVGGGKALQWNTPIKTQNGWKIIKELKIGDYVLTYNNTYCRVTGVIPQGVRDMYSVKFEDGRKLNADKEHLWEVYDKDMSNYRILTTREIIESGKYKDNSLAIRLLDVDYTDDELISDLPIESYLLGSMLILDTLTIENNHYFIHNKLKALGLYNVRKSKRFIPDIYLDSCPKARFDLLRGIMDSHANISKQGMPYLVIHANDRLVKDITTIVRSLGGKATLEKKFRGKLVTHKLFIEIKDNTLLFKKESWKKRTSGLQEDFKLNIKSITKNGTAEAVCIAVDNDKSLYVAKDYIITHNTFISLALSVGVNSSKVLIIAPKATVDDIWINSISNELFKNKQTLYTSLDLANGKEYNGEKYIVFHYESLKLIEDIFKKVNTNQLTIIVDEFHNMSDIKSDRTKLLLKLFEDSRSDNIILMSGTTIKAKVNELLPVFKILDKKFNKYVERRFMKIYKSPTSLLKQTLPARYGMYSMLIDKTELDLKPITYKVINIKLKDGKQYLMSTIKDNMQKYFIDRQNELSNNFMDYEDKYYTLLQKARQVIDVSLVPDKEWTKYEEDFNKVKQAYKNNQLMFIPETLLAVNQFEKDYILQALAGQDKKDFKEAKTVVKYLKLKVIGEVLANVVMKARIDCQVAIANKVKYNSIIDGSNKKTIIFTNYIDVCKAVNNKLSKTYKTIDVYGDNTKYLKQELSMFKHDKKYNPLITTFKSLGTGNHLTVANVEIMIGYPFRQFMYEQTVARIHRTGQTDRCVIYNIHLDTGVESNILDRDIDIISFYKEEVEKITGKDLPLELESRSKDNVSTESDEFTFLNEEHGLEDVFMFTDINDKKEKESICMEW